LIGCFQIRLRRITTATIQALTCFCLSPPLMAGKRARGVQVQATRFAGGR
jgi:hypothetical protein